MGRIMALEAKKLSLTQRVEVLEQHRDDTDEAVQTIRELAPIFKTATKLFKYWAPVIGTACVMSAASNGDKFLDVIGNILKSVPGM